MLTFQSGYNFLSYYELKAAPILEYRYNSNSWEEFCTQKLSTPILYDIGEGSMKSCIWTMQAILSCSYMVSMPSHDYTQIESFF